MSTKLYALLLTGAMLAAPTLASAQVSVNIHVPGLITMAPPPPRMEPMPGPRSGYVWAPGHWQWRGNDYAWREGHWQRARSGYDFEPGRWVPANGGWRWVEPNWKPGKHKAKGKGHGPKHDRRYDDYGHGGGYHCPPGQAKKGRC